MNKGYFHVIAGSLTLFICVSVQAATSYNYTSFDVDIAGAKNTRAYGIDGSNIVGRYTDDSGDYHGFKYDGSNYTALDYPGATRTYAYGIDGDNIVGRYRDGSGNYHGFKYDGSSYTAIDVDIVGAHSTRAHGIDGSNIVGYYEDSSGNYHGFKYDGSSYTALDVTSLGADDTYAYGIDGSNIAGFYYDGSSISHGFSYDGSSYTAIDETSLGAIKTYAYGIDDDNIVGYYKDSNEDYHGFQATVRTAFAAPVLWGTDEDTGNLIKIENYNSTPIVTDYGRLSINDGGTIHPFPDTDEGNSAEFSDIESFTLNDEGVAFMIGNTTVALAGGGTFSEPHLYSLRIFNADGTEAVRVDDASASNGFNALQSIGVISGVDGADPINGIDFDPISGLLFGVIENTGRDDLVIIDPATAAAETVAASMDGTNDIEDIQFDDQGNLFLIDADGGSSEIEDVLHRAVLDRSGAVPTMVSIQVVNSIGFNANGDDYRFESLGWDFQNNVLLGFSDESNSLFQLNTTSNGFTNLGGVGFNDIEGIDFVPTLTGLPTIPEPSTGLLTLLGLLVCGRRRVPTQ